MILKRVVIAVVIVLAIAIIGFFTMSDYLFIHGFVFFAGRQMQKRQVRLLCKTDHQTLLEACNELSKQVARGNLKPGKYSIRRDPNLESARFPQPILDLGPTYVYIDENDSGRVKLEMMGGLSHFGVEAYTEDYQKPSFVGFKFGDKELIPRLWYYDDGYDENPDYYKKIDALIQKGKKSH